MQESSERVDDDVDDADLPADEEHPDAVGLPEDDPKTIPADEVDKAPA